MFDAAAAANAHAVLSNSIRSLHAAEKEFRDLVGYITGNYKRTDEVAPSIAADEAREVFRQLRERAAEAESRAYRLLLLTGGIK